MERFPGSYEVVFHTDQNEVSRFSVIKNIFAHEFISRGNVQGHMTSSLTSGNAALWLDQETTKYYPYIPEPSLWLYLF